ncbi:MAG: DUF1801 domain-containing protein [Anaerolineaceae bacterium]|nr:DUF1801 domain-containing protein [Anaerolineaceae bacterium]
MTEPKTKPTDASVQEFLGSVDNDRRREDGFALLEMMREVTGEEPRMWGPSIVGFGSYHYKYQSGREGDTIVAGFSPRKQNLTLYLTGGLDEYRELLGRLGKHKTGKGCLYINKLQDVDLNTLRELIRQSVEEARRMDTAARG